MPIFDHPIGRPNVPLLSLPPASGMGANGGMRDVSRRDAADGQDQPDRGRAAVHRLQGLQQAAGNQAVAGLLAPAAGAPVQRNCIGGHVGPPLSDTELYYAAQQNPSLRPMIMERDRVRAEQEEHDRTRAHEAYAKAHPEFAPPGYPQAFGGDKPPGRVHHLMHQQVHGTAPRRGELEQSARNLDRDREIAQVDPRLHSVIPDEMPEVFPGGPMEKDD
jgi:hypothetical protein